MTSGQWRLAVALVAAMLAGTVHAADPDDMILFTETGSDVGLWRLSHGEPPPGSFYNPEGHADRGGAVVFNVPTFTPNPQIPLVGDVNGDGLDDMVRVGNNGIQDVFVASHSYDPTFGGGYGVLNTLGADDSFVGVDPTAFEYFVADINDDGRDDAVLVRDGGWQISPGGPNATVWETYLSGGGGLGNNGFSYSVVGNTANEHLVGDFNGDGRADIAERVGPGLIDPEGWIFAYTSDAGGLVDPITVNEIIQGAVNLGNEDTHVTTLIGDINNDGLDDVVEVDDRFEDGNWVFVAGATGASGAPSGFDIATGGISWASPFGAAPAGLTRQFARLADMNGDGYPDLVLYREYVENGFTFADWLVSYTDSSTGDLFNSLTYDSATVRLDTGINDGCIPLLGQFGPPIPAEDCSNGIDDDFDFLTDCDDPHCDLSPDCVCYGPEDDTVLFSEATSPGYWFLSHTICAADQPSFYNENPSEGLAYFNDVAMIPNPNWPLIGDVTGDGLDDLVRVGDDGFQQVFVATHSYDAGFGVGLLGAGTADSFVGLAQNAYEFFVGDVNNDGRDDAIAVKANDDPGVFGGDANIMVWESYLSGPGGLGPYGFTASIFGEVAQPAGGGMSPAMPLVGDFNGDGRTDIGYRRASDADVAPGYIVCTLSNAGGLDFLPSVDTVVQGFVSNEANHVATLVGDINGDGIDDVVEVDDRNGDGMWTWVAGVTGATAEPSGLGLGAGGYSWAAPFGPPNVGTTVHVPLLADINGDGFDDLVSYWEYPFAHAQGTMAGQWLVSFTNPATGDLFGSTFNDGGLVLIPTGFEGNFPLAGSFDLPGCSPEPFDADGDGDVDLADVYDLQLCGTGAGDPGGVFDSLRLRCKCMDDGDGDIDVAELEALQDCLGGPDAAPTCP